MLLNDPLLGLLAKQVDDLEQLRISMGHRHRLLVTDEESEDGQSRGMSLPEDHKDVVRAKLVFDQIGAAEENAIKHLQSYMRRSPWGPWLKEATGVGEKQLARFLATVRDPYWNDRADLMRPRHLPELWAYCGLHVWPTDDPNVWVAPRRMKGRQANWSEEARKRAWLIATSCVKSSATSRYRKVYDEARLRYAEATHQIECVRCGPSGKPALVGSPISAGHQHARALRAIAKRMVEDVWIEARRLHYENYLSTAPEPITLEEWARKNSSPRELALV